jgi:hypothetical protein
MFQLLVDVPMHTLLSICCKTPYLYSIQFWGMCIMYMELDLFFKLGKKVFEFEKMCQN